MNRGAQIIKATATCVGIGLICYLFAPSAELPPNQQNTKQRQLVLDVMRKAAEDPSLIVSKNSRTS